MEWEVEDSRVKLTFPDLVKSKFPFNSEEPVTEKITYQIFSSNNEVDYNHMYSLCYISGRLSSKSKDFEPKKDSKGKNVYYYPINVKAVT